MPELSACLVRLSVENGSLSCRVSLDNVTNTIRESWCKKECEKLGAKLTIIKSDETLYATLSFVEKGVEA